jgi:hypothetical protein
MAPSSCSPPCSANQICFNNTCLGTGSIDISLFWSPEGDCDIFVQMPYGTSISPQGYLLGPMFYTDYGQIDVTSTLAGPKNVFWNIDYEPPWGIYNVCLMTQGFYDINDSHPLVATVYVRTSLKSTQI